MLKAFAKLNMFRYECMLQKIWNFDLYDWTVAGNWRSDWNLRTHIVREPGQPARDLHPHHQLPRQVVHRDGPDLIQHLHQCLEDQDSPVRVRQSHAGSRWMSPILHWHLRQCQQFQLQDHGEHSSRDQSQPDLQSQLQHLPEERKWILCSWVEYSGADLRCKGDFFRLRRFLRCPQSRHGKRGHHQRRQLCQWLCRHSPRLRDQFRLIACGQILWPGPRRLQWCLLYCQCSGTHQDLGHPLLSWSCHGCRWNYCIRCG